MLIKTLGVDLGKFSCHVVGQDQQCKVAHRMGSHLIFALYDESPSIISAKPTTGNCGVSIQE